MRKVILYKEREKGETEEKEEVEREWEWWKIGKREIEKTTESTHAHTFRYTVGVNNYTSKEWISLNYAIHFSNSVNQSFAIENIETTKQQMLLTWLLAASSGNEETIKN